MLKRDLQITSPGNCSDTLYHLLLCLDPVFQKQLFYFSYSECHVNLGINTRSSSPRDHSDLHTRYVQLKQNFDFQDRIN